MKKIMIPKSSVHGKILRVNLNSGRIWTEDSLPYVRLTLGGRGLNSLLMVREIAPGVRWNDPENLLCIAPGSLVGTAAPGACRTDISTVSVFTNGKGSANAGGFWGAELKFAGYDALIIQGISEKPVYLFIDGDHVELRQAEHLWGLTTYETEGAIRHEIGPGRLEIAQIGPAGENLVRGSAIIMNTARAAGGSGVGCVMGVKHLKAIAVRGEGPVGVADPVAFMDALDHTMQACRDNVGKVLSMRKSLTERMTDMDFEGWNSIMVVRNGQDDFWPLERRKKLMDRATGVPSMHRCVRACAVCPAGCAAYLHIKEGPYAGRMGEGFWINTVMSASRFDLADPDAVIAFWLRCNELGLDTDYAAASLSWVIECFEKGIIGLDQTEGLVLRFADGKVLMQLLDMLVFRRGIGDKVADGAVDAARDLGTEAEYLLAHVKGQPSIEPFRVPKGWGLGVATSAVAGRHLRGATRGPNHSGPPNLDFNVTDYANQAVSVDWQARTKEIEDNLGLCVYVGTWSGANFLGPKYYVEMVSASLGIHINEHELMNRYAQVGRSLERAFNALHTDLGPGDDLPPERFLKEPVSSGPNVGKIANQQKYQEMLKEYYALAGWNPSTGFLRRKQLVELNLEELIEPLSKIGKLDQ